MIKNRSFGIKNIDLGLRILNFDFDEGLIQHLCLYRHNILTILGSWEDNFKWSSKWSRKLVALCQRSTVLYMKPIPCQGRCNYLHLKLSHLILNKYSILENLIFRIKSFSFRHYANLRRLIDSDPTSTCLQANEDEFKCIHDI